MSAAINTQIAFVMALARSDCAARGCLNAVVISGCWAAFVFTPVSETLAWCGFKCMAMLDVFPLSYGFLVPQYLHTITVLSTNLFPSSLYVTGKPKCSHTWDLNDAGCSSSSVPPLAMTTLHLTRVWIEHTHNFFHKSIRRSRVCQTEDIDLNGSWINDEPLHHWQIYENFGLRLGFPTQLHHDQGKELKTSSLLNLRNAVGLRGPNHIIPLTGELPGGKVQ